MDFPTEIFGLAVCGLAASRLLSVYGKEGGIVRDGDSLPDGFPFFSIGKREMQGKGEMQMILYCHSSSVQELLTQKNDKTSKKGLTNRRESGTFIACLALESKEC